MAWLGATNRSITSPVVQVTGVAAAPVNSSSINVSWNAAAGATTYTVTRNGSPIATPAGTSLLDTGLAASTTYTYAVAANTARGQGPFSSPPVSATTSSASTQAVKFFPGHYVESDTVLGKNGALASIQSEIDRITSLNNVRGYMILLTWGNLQQSAGVYDWTKLDPIVAYIKSKGKRWLLQLVSGSFTTTHPNSTSGSIDSNLIPAYIQQDVGTYGQAGYRVAGVTTQPSSVSGWWGGDGNGNTYGPALWRPNVMAEYVKLNQAIGARYDSDPSFEGIYQGEDSFYVGVGADNGADYNDITQMNGWLSLLQANCVAFPTSNVMFSETFMKLQAQSVTLVNSITDGAYTNHPPMLGQTDAFGANYRNPIHTWGTKTYTGVTPGFGSLGDRRSTNRFVSEIQAPDQGFFQNLGSPREDIVAGLNILGATHAFWAILPSPIAAVSASLPIHYPVVFASVPGAASGTLASPWILPSGTFDMITTGGGHMVATKGSTAVTFDTAPGISGTTMTIKFPLLPFNWFNGGTVTGANNGTDQTYTDSGLGAFINDPANALTNTAYPPDYP